MGRVLVEEEGEPLGNCGDHREWDNLFVLVKQH